jgi:cell division protein FtsB
MKQLPVKYFLALGAALFALHAPVMAASSEELTEIRSQLRNLMERVERLEQESDALKTQNEALQAKGELPKSKTRAPGDASAAQVDNVQSDGSAERVAFNGDLRYRHEQIRDDTQNASGVRDADRYRDRIRARLNAQVQVTEAVNIGIGFATSEGGDPRSSNQTLGDVFSRKSVNLDLAYFDWSFADWGHLVGGKMKQPFFKPGQSLFWDGDVNPEGLALTFERGVLFGSAYSYWVNEVAGPESARTSDTMLLGGQIGTRMPLGESNLVLAAHYYDLSAGQGRAPFFNGDPSGNTTIEVGVPPAAVLLYDYRVVDLIAEFNSRWNASWGAVPLQIWADIAQNQDPNDLDSAWSVGASLGKAAEARSWEFGAAYYSVEKDALFAQLIDNDLGNGLTDAAGWVLRAGYAPVKSMTLNATYFINKRNVDVADIAGQKDVEHGRLQLDFNMKF